MLNNDHMDGIFVMSLDLSNCYILNKSNTVAKKSNSILFIYALLLSLLICFVSTTLFAESAHFQDNAKVVSADMAAKLESELREIESKDGYHLEVVIIPNYNQRQPDAVITALTAQLAKNAPSADKRALLLIVLENNLAIIRPTPNIAAAYNTENSKDIIDNIKIQMNKKNYDEMARIGLAGMYHYYQTKFAIETKPASNTKTLLNVGLFIIALIGVVFMIRGMQKKQ